MPCHRSSACASWRSAYRGIFKDSSLDDERRTHWSGKLTAMAPDDTVLIARLGRRLLGEAMRHVAQRGETDVYLWVFDDNARASDLYRRLGGMVVEGGFDEIDGTQVAHSRIVWCNAARVADACAATP